MVLLTKPKEPISSIKGKDMAEELRNFAKRNGIDLNLANFEETKRILKKTPTSLSDEIILAREVSD